MIYVMAKEMIPDSQHGVSTDIATASAMVESASMMILDVAVG